MGYSQCISFLIHSADQRQRDLWCLVVDRCHGFDNRSQTALHVRCPATDQLIATLGGPQFRYTYANGDPVEYLIVLFKCTVSEETVSPTDFDETLALRWFACDEFLGLALPYPIELLFPHN